MEISLVPTCWAWILLDPFSLQACDHLGGSATEMLAPDEHELSAERREGSAERALSVP